MRICRAAAEETPEGGGPPATQQPEDTPPAQPPAPGEEQAPPNPDNPGRPLRNPARLTSPWMLHLRTEKSNPGTKLNQAIRRTARSRKSPMNSNYQMIWT